MADRKHVVGEDEIKVPHSRKDGHLWSRQKMKSESRSSERPTIVTSNKFPLPSTTVATVSFLVEVPPSF